MIYEPWDKVMESTTTSGHASRNHADCCMVCTGCNCVNNTIPTRAGAQLKNQHCKQQQLWDRQSPDSEPIKAQVVSQDNAACASKDEAVHPTQGATHVLNLALDSLKVLFIDDCWFFVNSHA